MLTFHRPYLGTSGCSLSQEMVYITDYHGIIQTDNADTHKTNGDGLTKNNCLGK